ncbi:MAG: FecR domain-containing protein [Paludibacter sp.]|jgi:ferric-dicitrate binding protein FerR (iron transport regulator)|nr:FecR domain-containing protein [Paludibacter sp.]
MKDIIIRFFDETISSNEKKQLHDWLKESEQNRKEFLEMHDIWASSALINKKFNAEKAMEVFIENMKKLDDSQRKHKKLRRIIQFASGVAATIALLFYINYADRLSDSVESRDNYTHVVKAQQSKERIVLPDGSVVWIDKGSVLSYSDRFNKQTRGVKIEGKAFFDVAKDKNKPFIVDLGEDKIKVYGTSFNVRNIIKESDVEIVLLTGSVGLELSGAQKNIMLKPNERVVYSKVSKDSHVETVDASMFNIWTQDKLTFDNNTLSNVIPCLEIWYDVAIECPEDLANNTRVSFTILNETKEQMLKVLALVAPVDYTVKDNHIFIYSKK